MSGTTVRAVDCCEKPCEYCLPTFCRPKKYLPDGTPIFCAEMFEPNNKDKSMPYDYELYMGLCIMPKSISQATGTVEGYVNNDEYDTNSIKGLYGNLSTYPWFKVNEAECCADMPWPINDDLKFKSPCGLRCGCPPIDVSRVDKDVPALITEGVAWPMGIVGGQLVGAFSYGLMALAIKLFSPITLCFEEVCQFYRLLIIALGCLFLAVMVVYIFRPPRFTCCGTECCTRSADRLVESTQTDAWTGQEYTAIGLAGEVYDPEPCAVCWNMNRSCYSAAYTQLVGWFIGFVCFGVYLGVQCFTLGKIADMQVADVLGCSKGEVVHSKFLWNNIMYSVCGLRTAGKKEKLTLGYEAKVNKFALPCAPVAKPYGQGYGYRMEAQRKEQERTEEMLAHTEVKARAEVDNKDLECLVKLQRAKVEEIKNHRQSSNVRFNKLNRMRNQVRALNLLHLQHWNATATAPMDERAEDLVEAYAARLDNKGLDKVFYDKLSNKLSYEGVIGKMLDGAQKKKSESLTSAPMRKNGILCGGACDVTGQACKDCANSVGCFGCCMLPCAWVCKGTGCLVGEFCNMFGIVGGLMDEGTKRQGYTYSDCQSDLAEREDDLIKKIERFTLTGITGDFTIDSDGEFDSEVTDEDKLRDQEIRKESLLKVQTLRFNLLVAQFDRFNLSRVTPGKASHYLSCGTNLRNARSEQERAMVASLNGEIRAPLLEASEESKIKEMDAEIEAQLRAMKREVSDAVSSGPASFRGSVRRRGA